MIYQFGGKKIPAEVEKNYKYFGRVLIENTPCFFWTNSKHQYYKLKNNKGNTTFISRGF